MCHALVVVCALVYTELLIAAQTCFGCHNCFAIPAYMLFTFKFLLRGNSVYYCKSVSSTVPLVIMTLSLSLSLLLNGFVECLLLETQNCMCSLCVDICW